MGTFFTNVTFLINAVCMFKSLDNVELFFPTYGASFAPWFVFVALCDERPFYFWSRVQLFVPNIS